MNESQLKPWLRPSWPKWQALSQVSQSFLIPCVKGIGERDFALMSAQAWLCLSITACKNPCGYCQACQLFDAGTHPDFHWLEADDKSKIVKIDAVRDSLDYLVKMPQISPCKVVVVFPAESLNVFASNALLKHLEEPSATTKFLLITHQKSSLLPTIISRCVSMPLRPPTHDDSFQWLIQTGGVDTKLAKSLLTWFGNCPEVAWDYLQQGVVDWRMALVDGIKMLLKHTISASDLAGKLIHIPILVLMDWFIQWTHWMLLAYHMDESQLKSDEYQKNEQDIMPVLTYLISRCHLDQIKLLQETIFKVRQQWQSSSSLNSTLLLERSLLMWLRLRNAQQYE